MPDGWTVEPATSGPSWAYQILAAPGTANHAATVRVEVTDVPCDEPAILTIQEDGWMSVCLASPSAVADSPRYVWLRIPYVELEP